MKKNKKFLLTLIILMMAQMLFAGGIRTDDPSKKDERVKRTEEVCEIYRKLKRKVTKESALNFKDYISDEFAKGITDTQFNNIIKMFSLDNPPIDESSSLEEKKLILSYYLLEKYMPRDFNYIQAKNFLFNDEGTNPSKTKITDMQKSNDFYISWIKENDGWYILGMEYDEDSPLHMREKKYDFNKDHARSVFVAQRYEEPFLVCATFPLPLTKENFERYYPGGYFRFKEGRNIYFTAGCSWQLTDIANYFFFDAGVEGRFNIFFGEHFSISPELAALGKLNLVTSDPSIGIAGEGSLTFHFINNSGCDMLAIKTFYQHSLIFPFKKDSDRFDLGTIGLGFYINLDDIF